VLYIQDTLLRYVVLGRQRGARKWAVFAQPKIIVWLSLSSVAFMKEDKNDFRSLQ
jgi:hypothetical protein